MRIGALLAIGWVAGFAWFTWQSFQEATPPAHADGIVVLTGGAERIEAGLRLLSDGRSPKLLISGVGRLGSGGPDLAELAHLAGMDAAPLAPFVTLGRAATTTLGNAAETAQWVSENDVHTLIVVTAGYHMPRALLELGRMLPDVTLHPVPVRSPLLRGSGKVAAFRLLLIEYSKFLAAGLGLARLGKDAP